MKTSQGKALNKITVLENNVSRDIYTYFQESAKFEDNLYLEADQKIKHYYRSRDLKNLENNKRKAEFLELI